MKKKIAIVATLLLLFVGLLNLVDEFSVTPDSTRRHEYPQREASGRSSSGGERPASEIENYVSAIEKPPPPSLIRANQRGSNSRPVGGSDASEHLAARSMISRTETQMFFIRSGAILESAGHTDAEEKGLRDATEKVIWLRLLSGPVIVFDADAVPSAAGGFLISASEKTDLTEAVKTEYDRLEKKRNQQLTQNKVERGSARPTESLIRSIHESSSEKRP